MIHILRKTVLLIVVAICAYSSFAQGNIVTLRLTEPAYYTANLNINGVAIRSMILVADSATLTNAIKGKYVGNKLDTSKKSILLNAWIAGFCGEKYLLHTKEVVNSFRKDAKIKTNYVPKFIVEPSRIYLIIEDPGDFIAVYQSIAQKTIPPPVVPKGESDPTTYRHAPLCEIDGCVALCVTKTEASFELCCDDYCFTISYDGELSLTASRAIVKK